MEKFASFELDRTQLQNDWLKIKRNRLVLNAT